MSFLQGGVDGVGGVDVVVSLAVPAIWEGYGCPGERSGCAWRCADDLVLGVSAVAAVDWLGAGCGLEVCRVCAWADVVCV